MNELSRRDFLKLSGAVGAGTLWPEKTDYSSLACPSLGEVIRISKEVNPRVTAVNLSCVPDYFANLAEQGSPFHHRQETLMMTIPYPDIKKGKPRLYGYAPGLKEAINHAQVGLVVEIPPTPDRYDPEKWGWGLGRNVDFYQGAKVFIIGSEVNFDNRVFKRRKAWQDKLPQYRDLYERSFQIIRRLSPESLVFPWQEAYFGKGEFLKSFLAMEGVKKEVDGLAFNFYDRSALLEERVALYQKILDQHGLGEKPIIVSELGKPIKAFLSAEEQANLVVQNLATAAFLAGQGKIKWSAWYSAFCLSNDGHALSYLKEREFMPRPGLFAFLACQRLLVGEIGRQVDSTGLVRVTAKNPDLKTEMVWNEGEKEITLPPKPESLHIWSAAGQSLVRNRPIILKPSRKPQACGGEAVIFLSDSKDKQKESKNLPR